MNDKLIINSISKVYFIIVSFFIFIFLILSIIYLVLSNGVYLKELSFSSFHINKVYIKIDKTLNISIDKITILSNENSDSIVFQTKDIKKYLKPIGFIASFIQSIIIDTIHYRDIEGRLRYVDNEGGYIRASSDNFNMDTIIHKTDNYINFEIINFTDSIKKIHSKGNIVLDLINRELLLKLNIIINNEIDLNYYTFIDAKQLKYAIETNKNITDYTSLISILNVNPALEYWILDAIEMKKVIVKKVYGFIEFLKPYEAFDNLYISLDIDKLIYTYHKDLDGIHTDNTNLEFKHGILTIRPYKHTTYDFDLDRSWLFIDFNKVDIELTLHLLFDGFLNKNLLHILNTFGIKLPFKQNTGKLKTDLTLIINLMNLDVDAKGSFFTKKSNFTYLGLDLDIFNARIELDNHDIKIDKMFAKYKKNISVNVKANLDTKNDEGTISFDVKKMNFNNMMLSLDAKEKLHIEYKMSSFGDTISLSKSQWTLLSKEKVYIKPITVPFNYENLFATIPTTKIQIGNIATIYASGSTSLKTFSTNLELDITKFKYEAINLTQSNLLLDFSFSNSEFILKSDENIEFTLSNKDCVLNQPRVSFYSNRIIANSSKFKIDNLLESKLAFSYTFKNSRGFLNLKNLKFENDLLGSMFENNKFIGFKLKKNNGNFTAYCTDMDMLITLADDEWRVDAKSLKLLHQHSKLLQKYDLKDGEISIFKEKNKIDINFLANINHQYKFIAIDDELISKYIINGHIKENTGEIDLHINNKIHVTWDDQISIRGKDIGINLSSVIDFLSFIKDDSDTSKTKNIDMELIDSYIYFSEDRRAISNKINLQYYNEIATAQLHHKGAVAGFKLQDDNFFLYGEDFNDKFMDNLFALSKFEGGSFDFSIKGSLEEFVGILYLKNTTIVEYKLLNNILAFINTIPSLITFSLPGYNNNGLEIKSSYINFAFKDDQYILKDIYLNSKEMDIIGNGKASYKNNTIDLNLNLKTDLASSASKIPVIGYIIFNEDSISTSLRISGALNNPEVESMLATDIIVAPLNIIKRTILFPFKIFE